MVVNIVQILNKKSESLSISLSKTLFIVSYNSLKVTKICVALSLKSFTRDLVVFSKF